MSALRLSENGIVGMSGRPFPKPPPAAPLPLEEWLDQADRSEAGREAFFRGRDAEFDIFRRAVGSLHDGRVGGGTMVFQGAPGAGKSALMAECMEAVRAHSTPDDPWVAVAIKPETLRSSADVVMLLVEAANAESERLSKTVSGTVAGRLGHLLDAGRKLYGELSGRGIGIAGISVGGKPEAGSGREADMVSERAFRNAAPLLENLRLVVLVDEAQNVPAESTTQGVMDCLHDPPGGIPLVTVFFGLSDTQHALRRCGLSRFASGRVVNLGPLQEDDAACAIRSVFDAYGFTGTPEDLSAWVGNLAELSQGWPQHINRVAVAASRVVLINGGRIVAACLDEAMTAAMEYKNEYYAGRLAAGSRPPWVYRQMALVAEEKGGVLPYDDLRQFLSEETLDDFLTNALRAGLLAQTKDLPYHYRIPIPSFGDYLRMLPVKSPQA